MNKLQRLVLLHQTTSAIDTEKEIFSIPDPNYCVTGHAKRDSAFRKEGLDECWSNEHYQEFFGLTKEEVLSFYISYSYKVDHGEAGRLEALTKIEKLVGDNTLLVVQMPQRSPWARVLPLLFLMVLL